MLQTPGKFFEKFQKINKLYQRFFRNELADYGFTPNEVMVLLFLHNNAPEFDTATDIVRCKGISKGLAAQSIDSLCRKGYLVPFRDPRDRRIIHLKLSESCFPIRERIEKRQSELFFHIQQGISPETLKIAYETIEKLTQNTEALLMKEAHHEE